MSATNCDVPVTLSKPSKRWTRFPTTENFSALATVLPSVGFGDGFVNVQALNLGALLPFAEGEAGIDFVVDHRHHRFENFIIAGAAAEIARHPLLDFLFGGLRSFVQKRLGRHDLPGGAGA